MERGFESLNLVTASRLCAGAMAEMNVVNNSSVARLLKILVFGHQRRHSHRLRAVKQHWQRATVLEHAYLAGLQPRLNVILILPIR